MNELINSYGLYLLSHKDNPIFLSIGYFTCHWCHVIAREVFEHEDVAKILNKNFVCIKVDREESPDIESFYGALSILWYGQVGWLANLFLTPDLKPFFGFTYLPKPNFIKIVSTISRMWQENSTESKEYAQKIYEYLTKDYLSSDFHPINYWSTCFQKLKIHLVDTF